MSIWNELKYFKKSEFNYPDKLKKEILLKVDCFRAHIQSKLIVTSDFREGPGQHQGFALDIIAPDWKSHLLDLYFQAERFGFDGIGVYSFWQYYGRTTGGLHVDFGGREKAARWLSPEKGLYLPLDILSLKKYKII
jgi:hypothetical protein